MKALGVWVACVAVVEVALFWNVVAVAIGFVSVAVAGVVEGELQAHRKNSPKPIIPTNPNFLMAILHMNTYDEN